MGEGGGGGGYFEAGILALDGSNVGREWGWRWDKGGGTLRQASWPLMAAMWAGSGGGRGGRGRGVP